MVLMNGRNISGAGKLAGLAGGIFVGVTTGNPFPAIAAAVDFVAWVNGVWQESNQKHASSQRPTQTVSEIFGNAMESRAVSAFSPPSGHASSAGSGQFAWTARSTESDRAAVRTRAKIIAHSSKRGNEVDHWLQATVELHIAKRAEEISRTRPGSGDLDNWLQAERELLIAQRAREIANSPAAAGELDNWLRAEREVLTRLRAAEIAKSPDSGSDMDNWLQAEREVLIAQRARELAASPGTGGELDNWLQAETDLMTRGVIRPRPDQAGFGVAQRLTVRAIFRVRSATA